jgi:type I restriction enzyme S subunit
MKLTCAPWMPPEYIFLYFSRLTVVDYIKGNAVAAGVPHINLGFLRNFPLLIPSRESLSAFSFLVAPLLDRMRANQRESSSLLLMRDALLPRLLSGLLKDEIATEGVEP